MTVDEIISHLSTDAEPSFNVEMHMLVALLGQHRGTWRALRTSALFPGHGYTYRRVSGEIDAARLLFHMAFPGWCYRLAECSVSDDAWVVPDFNHPQHGHEFQRTFPAECQRDPVEWFGTDVDLRPSGRPAQAFCLSMMIAHKKLLSWKEEACRPISPTSTAKH
jgi:hypothetical protein